MTAKIISFEGLDKSGKHSMLNLTRDHLESLGYNVKEYSFPNYESETGKLIRKYLINELNITPLTFELLQTADKIAVQDNLKNDLINYDFILIDRYTHSQYAYGLLNTNKQYLMNILEPVINPDIVLFFDVSVENSMNRKGEHGDNDKYESNKLLLEQVRKNYVDVLSDKWLTFETDVFTVDSNQTLKNVELETLDILNDILNNL